MKLLVTGGAGFIGSCFVRKLIKDHPQYDVINVDKLTYAGNLDNLTSVADAPRYRFVQADITDRKKMKEVIEDHNIEAIINFAAESHVDRSIEASEVFIKSNIVGTHVLLELARISEIKRFVQVSTDEVYGALGSEGFFSETTPIAPNSPYAASKSSADLLVRSYFQTYDMPLMITRCSNNYGPFQYPEKMLPFFILRAMNDESLPLYGDGRYIRDWIHVEDHCDALIRVLEAGQPGEVYNIGARCEKENIEIARHILTLLDKPVTRIEHVANRLGHDRRYAIDSSKIEKTLHWKPKFHIDDELPQLIRWYKDNKEWIRKINARKSS